MQSGQQDDEQDDEHDASQRLRAGLAAALALLAGLACITIAVELVQFTAGYLDAQRQMAAAATAPSPSGPLFVNNLRFDWSLAAEAIVVEPLFLLCIVGLVAYTRRASWSLSVAALVAYNLGAISFGVFALGLDAGWSTRHGLAAVLVNLIGLPIAELGLWALFRPGERERYAR